MRYLLYIFLFFIYSCAIPSSPEGGEKDKLPPQLIETKPKNLSTEFDGYKVIIRFDEFVGFSKEYSVKRFLSPLLEKPPKVLIIPKGVKIVLEDTLSKNTTYSVNLNGNIDDITEKNVAENLHFVFSTGKTIDSFSIIGSVKDVYTNSPVENALVMLYDEASEDSIPLKESGTYYTNTDTLGHFLINYLPHKKFKIFVLEEENSSFVYDKPEENIGFLNEVVESSIIPYNTFVDTVFKRRKTFLNVVRGFMFDDSLKVSEIKTFNESLLPQFVQNDGHLHRGKSFVLFNTTPDSSTFRVLNPTKSEVLIGNNPKKDTLFVWYRDNIQDSLVLEITNKNEVLDTLKILQYSPPSNLREEDIFNSKSFRLNPISDFSPIAPQKEKKRKQETSVTKRKRKKKQATQNLKYEKKTPLFPFDSLLFEFPFPTEIKQETLCLLFQVSDSVLVDSLYSSKVEPNRYFYENEQVKSYTDSLLLQDSIFFTMGDTILGDRKNKVVYVSSDTITWKDIHETLFFVTFKKNETKVKHYDSLKCTLSKNPNAKYVGYILKSEELTFNKVYRFVLPEKSLTNFYSHVNDSLLSIDFKTVDSTKYGRLDVDVSLEDSANFVFQLVQSAGKSKEYKIVYEDVFEGKNYVSTIKYLAQGDYFMRIIDDKNKNGVWDTGNYLKKRQPEEIYFNNIPLTVKPEWTITQSWEVGSVIDQME